MELNVEKKIAYVGPFSFPKGGAAARRILGVSKSLKGAGYSVVIGSGQMSSGNISSSVEYFEGFEVHSIGERTAENSSTFVRNFKYLNIGKKTIEWLDAMEVKPSAIILYSGYSPYFIRLIPWCKRNKVPLIFDAVEWYEAPSFFKALISPYYWNIELAMRYYSIKAKNIIAISTYLEDYYLSKKASVLVVPPTIDAVEFTPKSEMLNNNKLTLAYSGTPGRKDLFNNYLEAIFSLDYYGERLILKVAGLTVEDILNYPAMINRNITSLPHCISTIGCVSHSAAIDLVKNADFSVLLRKPTRVAQAGFPTKFVESLTVGTPIIANITSDLGEYLMDGKNGLICDGYSPENLIVVLKKALRLSKSELNSLRESARETAVENFDYRQYVNKLREFMNSIG